MRASSSWSGVATLLLLVLAMAPASAKESNLNCSDGSCDEDEAPCPPDSAPEFGTDGSTCVCVQKHCVQPVCRHGSRSELQKRGTSKPGDCCDIYQCVMPKEKNCSEVVCPKDGECPSDSYRLPSHKSPNDCCSLALGCKCLPGPCPEVNCPEGEHPSVIRPGSGTPGSCCPLFECLNHDSNDTCMLDGKLMKNGSEEWKNDCTRCECNNGLIFCGISPVCPDLGHKCTKTRVPAGECCPICTEEDGTVGGCVSADGKIRPNGATWQDDPCTTCECVEGVDKCQAYMCEVMCVNARYVDGECCPLCEGTGTSLVTLPPHCPGVTNCSLRCMHGFRRDLAGCYVIPCQCEAEQCLLECVYGYAQDTHGNKLCKCATVPSQPAALDCPSLAGCRKNCSQGYRTTKAGCAVCKCNPQCKALAGDCGKNCPHGFRTNDRGCPICKCQGSPESYTPEVGTATTALKSRFDEGISCISSDGESYDEGETWYDGCRQCYCHSGEEMCNLIACPVPKCKNPVINVTTGCCPQCPDTSLTVDIAKHSSMVCESVAGEYRVEGETWTLDSETRCLCHSGRVLCASKQCPPAACPKPVPVLGSLCPVCPKQAMALGGDSCSPLRIHGAEWREGNCRSCSCVAGEVKCFDETCPALQCARPVLAKSWCCPVCLDHTAPKTCVVGNITYHSDEQWNSDACTHCTCVAGSTSCTEKVCSVTCPNPVKLPGKCCPVCKPDSTRERAYLIAIAFLTCTVVAFTSFLVYQRCSRRRRMIVNAPSVTTHSYTNYSTRTPPPQYDSTDRKKAYDYEPVEAYDKTIRATEKLALAPV